MTKLSSISKADLKRAADVAKSENVMVEIEAGGRVIRVSPILVAGPSRTPIAPIGGIVL